MSSSFRKWCRLLWLTLIALLLGLALFAPTKAYAEDEEEASGPLEAITPDHDASDFEDVPTVAFGDPEPGLEEARDLLEERFGHFLERQPLGFDSDLVDTLAEDLGTVREASVAFLSEPTSVDLASIIGAGFALVIFALFGLCFVVLDRQFVDLAHRLQASLHFDTSLVLTNTARKTIIILGRSAALIALIVLSFFPVRAVFDEALWPALLTDILGLVLLYRIIKTALLTTLRLHPRNARVQPHYARLDRLARRALQIIVGFLIAIAAVDRLGYHDDMGALLYFSLRLSLVLWASLLFRHRQDVLALFPREPRSRWFQVLRSLLDHHFSKLMALTVILLGFFAAGYVDVSLFLLTRIYALLAIALIWFTLLERFHHFVALRAQEAADDDAPPSPLPRALERWLIVVGTITILSITLRLLGIAEPLFVLLQIPLIIIGHLELSPYNLLVVLLIVAITMVSIPLFKAVLNAKLYPLLDIDVGVAYAVNTLINYALFVLAFILCLMALGVQFSAVMVVFASLGVGIGFGLQNIAENLISGFIILFGRAVKKGDYITVNDLYGRVEAVGARSVVVRTPDNYSMLIPSKEIVSGRIVNWTFHDDIVRIHIPIGVSYDSDPTEVKEILLEAATKHPDILANPAPDVWISEFGDNSIVFDLLVFFECRVTNERTLKGKFNFILWEALQDADIEIPFPQRDLHLRSVTDDAFGASQANDRPAES